MDADRPAIPAVYRSSVWSSRVDLVVTDPGVIVEAAHLLHQTLERVDTVASRFRPDSEINLLHRAADGSTPMVVSDDLVEAIGVALRAARLTDGAVDPTVGAAMCRLGYDRDFSLLAPDVAGTLPKAAPTPGWRSVILDVECSTVVLDPGTVLDLGATAKAWASDRAAHLIAVTSRVRNVGLVGWGHHRRRAHTRGRLGSGYRRHMRRPQSTDHRGHRVGRTGHFGDRQPSLAHERPAGPPPARPGNRPPRHDTVEDCVGDGRILRRRQHGVDGSHGDG